MHDPYCYPGSDVLMNKFDLRDKNEAKEMETDATIKTIAALRQNPIPGIFNLQHLQKIHYHIFEPVYEWAGKTRTTTIEKGNTTFVPVEKLQKTAKILFAELNAENLLKNLTPEHFTDRAAHYFAEINKLHPFREGNCICQLKSVPPSQLKSVPLYAIKITEPTRLFYN